MTPDEKITYVRSQILAVMDKYERAGGKSIDRVVEKDMKVMDHKVTGIGQMISVGNQHGAAQCLDHAMMAIERLSGRFDTIIAGRAR